MPSRPSLFGSVRGEMYLLSAYFEKLSILLSLIMREVMNRHRVLCVKLCLSLLGPGAP